MSGIASAILVGSGISAISSMFGAKTAATAQTNASRNAIGAQMQMFQQGKTLEQPFIDAGTSALPTLQKLLTPGPGMTETLSQIPGFTFAQDWGNKAVQNLGTARGLGGNVLTAGANYATGLAQQGWGNIVNSLQGLVNTGQGAANAVLGGGIQTGQGIGGNLVGIGNAQAGSNIATANAAGNFANSISTAAILSKLTGQNGMYANPVQPGVSNGVNNFLNPQAG